MERGEDTSSKRACLFCGHLDDLTREHVYPLWCYDYIPPQSGNFNVQHLPIDPTNGLIQPTASIYTGRRPPKNNVTIRLFCRECNNGWMSNAEGSTKRLIGQKLSEENPSLEFSEADSFTLAHWASLKTVVAAMALGTPRLDPGVYYDIRRGNIPARFYVEVSRASSLEINSLFGPVAVWSAKEKADQDFIKELAAHSFVGCYQLGRLMFRISYVRSHDRVTRVRMAYPTTVLHPYRAKVPFESFHQKGEGALELPLFAATMGIIMDYHLTREGKKFFSGSHNGA